MHAPVASRLYGRKLFCLCLAAAFCILALMSTCSFLYPTNTWVDAQCFYTVGKTIARGGVLYRDIYEQKGPLLYFLHACVEWLPFEGVNPFLEIFALEVLAAAATLFFLMKALALYLGEKPRTLAYLPLLCVLVYCNRAFSLGDSAEEFSLPMAAYVLYATLRMLHDERHELSRGSLYAIGVLCGCVLWIKYTCLAFAVGALIVPLCVVIRERNWRLLGRAAAFVGLGVLTVCVPVLLYFALHDALDALWNVYFYNNIFAYTVDGGAAARLSKVNLLIYRASQSFGFLLFALGGWIYALRRRWRAEALHLPCIVIVTLLVIVAGGRVYVYSVLPLAVLSVTGLPALDAALGRLWPARRKAALIAVSALLCVGLSYPLWNRSLRQGRDNVFAYRLVEIMDPVPDATLLDLGTLDSGLYTAGDFDPITPYFCRLNLVTPEMVEEWRRIIRNGEADYIYTGDQTLDDYCPPEEQASYALLYSDGPSRRLYRLEQPENG